MGLFTPIWLKPDADPVQAANAVQRIRDQDKLKKIALEAVHDRVREYAVCRIDDEQFLLDYALTHTGHSRSRDCAAGLLYSQPMLLALASHDFRGDHAGSVLAQQAAERITDRNALMGLLGSPDSRIRQTVLERLDDPEEYEKAVIRDGNLAEWAFEHIRDRESQKNLLLLIQNDLTFSRCLEKLLANGRTPDADALKTLLEKTADPDFIKWSYPVVVRLITDEKLLEDIALHSDSSRARRAALTQISDDKVLSEIAMNEKEDYYNRTEAYARLKCKELVDEKTAQYLRRVEMSEEEKRFADIMSADSY